MKRRSWPKIAGALTCGALAAYLTAGYLRVGAAPAEANQRRALQVVVAAKDLIGGSVLKAADLKTIEWAGDSVPSGFIAAPDEALGHALLAPVRANEPLLTSKLAGEGAGAGLAVLIPAGMRAMSVRVDEVISVAGFVTPGTRVDVLATLAGTGGARGSGIVLQNLQVLAAGQSVQADQDGKPQTASVITLLVSPREAEILNLAAAEGRIQLALRNNLDGEIAPTSGIRAGLLGEAPPPAAPARTTGRATAPRQNRAHVVEIYNGSTRSVASF